MQPESPYKTFKANQLLSHPDFADLSSPLKFSKNIIVILVMALPHSRQNDQNEKISDIHVYINALFSP